jgi:hypothetical protein
VPGWAADQAWLRYQRGGTAWHPCAVLIGHMVENINRVVNQLQALPRAGTAQAALHAGRGPPGPAPGSHRPEDLKDPARVTHATSRAPSSRAHLDRFEVIRLARTAAYRAGRQEWPLSWAEVTYQPGTEAFHVLTAVLIHFGEQVRAEGATPVVLVFPHIAELHSYRSGGPEPHAALCQRWNSAG